MFISRRVVSFCDICGSRGPCQWCGRKEWIPTYVEEKDEIKHAENAGTDPIDNDSDTAIQQHRDEQEDHLQMAQQRVRYESRQLPKDKGAL